MLGSCCGVLYGMKNTKVRPNAEVPSLLVYAIYFLLRAMLCHSY